MGSSPFEADLHIHTARSGDARIEPRGLVAEARGLGLFAIAVTDHNTVAGVREVAALARGQDLLVVPGVEVSSRDGHVLALGVSEDVPAGLSADETIRLIGDLNRAYHVDIEESFRGNKKYYNRSPMRCFAKAWHMERMFMSISLSGRVGAPARGFYGRACGRAARVVRGSAGRFGRPLHRAPPVVDNAVASAVR